MTGTSSSASANSRATASASKPIIGVEPRPSARAAFSEMFMQIEAGGLDDKPNVKIVRASAHAVILSVET